MERVTNRQAMLVLVAAGALVVVGVSAFIAASSVAPASDPPSASPAPTIGEPLVRRVEVINNPDVRRPLRLEVADWSGTFVAAEAPTSQELRAALAAARDADPRVGNPPGDETRLIVAWGGGACDRTATLAIAEDARHMTYTQGPRDACDAMGIGWAVRLSFSKPVPAGEVVFDFREFRPQPEP